MVGSSCLTLGSLSKRDTFIILWMLLNALLWCLQKRCVTVQ